MEISHFSHHHRLVLLDQETDTAKSPKHCCFGCEEAVEGSTYSCRQCGFFLHKKCAELPGEINHPLHHQHPLVLSVTPYRHSIGFLCNLCYGEREGFAYHCSSCKFDLDIRCATHPKLVAGDFQKLQHFSHDHPLIFKSIFFPSPPLTIAHNSFHPTIFSFHLRPLETRSVRDKHMEINHFSHHHRLVLLDPETGTDQSPKHYCSGCEEAAEGSTYSCRQCRFFLHKKCAELPGVQRDLLTTAILVGLTLTLDALPIQNLLLEIFKRFSILATTIH
ncbi:hypothetical protein SLEP1_g10657 [Rubroshorea leprosula]|uniref:DC1 domain-containing protein n=1 Tax=Rubroshorea leprosula TaxID=152421 RepID=A0AAV5IIP4_9ROSI|nr:hypothetical protein SLEP1_g10657 [Rubroshorea leprosula]